MLVQCGFASWKAVGASIVMIAKTRVMIEAASGYKFGRPTPATKIHLPMKSLEAISKPFLLLE